MSKRNDVVNDVEDIVTDAGDVNNVDDQDAKLKSMLLQILKDEFGMDNGNM